MNSKYLAQKFGLIASVVVILFAVPGVTLAQSTDFSSAGSTIFIVPRLNLRQSAAPGGVSGNPAAAILNFTNPDPTCNDTVIELFKSGGGPSIGYILGRTQNGNNDVNGHFAVVPLVGNNFDYQLVRGESCNITVRTIGYLYATPTFDFSMAGARMQVTPGNISSSARPASIVGSPVAAILNFTNPDATCNDTVIALSTTNGTSLGYIFGRNHKANFDVKGGFAVVPLINGQFNHRLVRGESCPIDVRTIGYVYESSAADFSEAGATRSITPTASRQTFSPALMSERLVAIKGNPTAAILNFTNPDATCNDPVIELLKSGNGPSLGYIFSRVQNGSADVKGDFAVIPLVNRTFDYKLVRGESCPIDIKVIGYLYPTGTIIQKATKTEGGVTADWDSPSFIIAYDTPYGINQTATIDPMQTLTDMPIGSYKIKGVTLPSNMSGVTLQNINGSPLPYTASLATRGTMVVTFNFRSVSVEASTGTIIVKTTKTENGVTADWDSPPFTVNYTGPGGMTDATIDTDANGQQAFPGSLTGTYTVNGICPTCLPTGVTLSNITPMSQELLSDGVIIFTINFTAVVTPVPTLTVTPSSASVQVGGTTIPPTFTAIYNPGDGTGPRSVTASWSSSDNSIATINSSGVATGNSVGSAGITATYAGLTSIPATLTVTAPVPGLIIIPSSASVAINSSKQFKACFNSNGTPVTPLSATDCVLPDQDVTSSATWSPREATKVTISGGLAERIGHGTASVSASYSGLSDSAVVLDPARIRVIPASKSLQYGETVQLSACLDPNGTVSVPSGAETCPAGTTSVTDSSNWTSNRPTRAKVDNSSSKGLVTTQNTPGPATIRALYSGLMGSAGIQVGAPPIAPLTVSCSASPIETTTSGSVTWTAVASGGTGSYSYLWLGSSPLNGKTSNPVTVTYTTTTPNPKTGRVRVTSGGPPVTQDCTTSVAVTTPPPPPPPPTATLSANPEIIDEGQSATLTWTSTNNATSCDSSDFSTGSLPSNTSSDVNPDVQVSPSSDTTYRIYCTNSGGSGPVASATITVVSVKASISAKPSCINGGGNSEISWSTTPASQVASCTVSGPGLSSSSLSGSQTVNVTSKSTYKIECRTISDSIVTKQVIVDVAGCWSEF